MQTPRENTLSKISNHILGLELSHPIRVGIDGITASGKSTFARDLVSILEESGRACLLTTLDGFHNPRSVRHQRGRESAEGYYFDAYNYESVIRDLLNPLGGEEPFMFKTETYDLDLDRPSKREFEEIDKHTVVVVDGSFSLRKELIRYWDCKIYLKVDFETAVGRAESRDEESFGSKEKARHVTEVRYHGAHLIHNEEAKPWNVADFIVDNNVPPEAFLVS